MLIGTLQFARMEGLSESHSSPLEEVIEAIKSTESELKDIVASQNTAATTDSALYTTNASFNRGGSSTRGSFRGRGAFAKRFDNRSKPYPTNSGPGACLVCGKRDTVLMTAMREPALVAEKQHTPLTTANIPLLLKIKQGKEEVLSLDGQLKKPPLPHTPQKQHQNKLKTSNQDSDQPTQIHALISQHSRQTC